MSSHRRYAPAAAMAGMILAMAGGCASSDTKMPAAGEIADCEQFFITADSADLRQYGSLAVADDTTLRMRLGDVTASIHVAPCDSLSARGFGYESEQPVVDMLFRLENAAPMPRVYRPTTTPCEIYLTPLETDSLFRLLLSHEQGDVLLPSANKRYSWPAVSDNAAWYMAAAELCMASGDDQQYRRLRYIVRNMMATDTATLWDRRAGLFHGTPEYIVDTPGLPQWMTPTDILQNITMADNVERYAAAVAMLALDTHHGYSERSLLPIPPDSLRRNINTQMWVPNLGHYSGMLYGAPCCPVQLQSADNMAQALAVLAGAASQPMAETLVRRTRTPVDGIEQNTPRWGDTEIWHPHTQTLWTAASARAGNETAYRAAVAALLYRSCRQTVKQYCRADSLHGNTVPSRPVTGMILRALLGVSYRADGMYFKPFVPESLPGSKRITGLRYRDAILDIHLSGTGNAVSTFTIDSVASEPVIRAGLKGRHEISITLGGASADPGTANISDSPSPVCPPAPTVSWPQERLAQISSPGDDGNEPDAETDSYMVYLDGVVNEQIYRHSYTLYNADDFTVVQFVPFNDERVTGFSTTPYYYIPPRKRIMVYAASQARTGTRLIQDKSTAARFVELTRYRNSNFRFKVDAPRAGLYMVDVQYIDGLGIVNHNRRTTLRRLQVNGRNAGTFVLQQLSPAWWNKEIGDSWQGMTAWSNAVTVELVKGENELAIRFVQPSPVYLQPSNNSVLVDVIRLIPLGDNMTGASRY